MAQTATLNAAPALVPFGAFGPRVAPLTGNYPVATLVLGLGQVGWHAASLFSKMLSAGIAPEQTGRIQYLALARRPPVIPEGWLYQDNYLPLTLAETDWAQIPNHYTSGVARWWPKPPRDQSLVTDHTMVRAYGRLLLFDDPKRVTDELQQRVVQLIRQSIQPGSDGRRLILILSSLAEAEGSAMLLDVATVLRLMLVDSPTTMVALLTADAGAISETAHPLAMANVYAALKEIDAVMVNPTHYQLGLPMLNRTGRLTRMGAVRPLDYVLITGDSASNSSQPPAEAITEMAFSWLQLHHSRPDYPLPPLPPLAPDIERFDGYTTFNVSKLGLPVSGVVDLIASDLAKRVLTGLLAPETETTIPDWVKATISAYQQAMKQPTLFDEPKVRERWRDMLIKVNEKTIIPQIDATKDQPDFSMEKIGFDLIHQLDVENETNAASATSRILEDGTPARRLDTLRTRIEDALDQCRQQLEPRLVELPTQVACMDGHSLRWTIAALDALIRQLDALHDLYCQKAVEAEQAWHDARQRATDISADYDKRYTGIMRRLRGFNNADLQEVLQTYDQTAKCLAEYIRWTASAVEWQHIREALDRVQQDARITVQRAETLMPIIAAREEAIRKAINDAIQQKGEQSQVIAPVNAEWFQKAIAQATPGDIPPDKLTAHIFQHWLNGRSIADCRIEQFLQELIPACRQMPASALQITPLRQYVLEQSGAPLVKQGMQHFQNAAVPKWLPYRETTGWTAHEWLRASTAGTMNLSLLPPASGDTWQRLNLVSGDPDEICLTRIIHKVSADAIEQLRNPYRRAYERMIAEGLPLHIDRQWETMLADLIPNTVLKEVSALWEGALRAASEGASAIRQPLSGLIKLFAQVLHVDPAKVQAAPTQANDFLLTVFELPPSRLRLPPRRSPVVFTFSKRPADKLGQDIYRSVAALGLAEHFVFVVNLTNRRDMDSVMRVFRDEAFNAVVIDEAHFKSIVSAPEPRRALDELVLAEVDLTIVSPFYTKAPVPEHMFFGREREIADIRAKIRRHSVALIGGRRIGKTSALQHVDRLLRLPDSGYRPYYLDCHNATSYVHFFNAIRRRWQINTSTPDPTAFEDIVTDLKRKGSQQIVFLFDEVDRLLITDREQADTELLFRTFRALSNENHCQFIFSGERWLSRTMMNADSALFNFALPVRLAMLERATVERLIVEPFEMMNIWLEDVPTLVERIYKVSAGHPNIVQMICQEIVTAIDSDPDKGGLVTMAHLDKALGQHQLQEEMIKTFWGQMCELARLVTLIWPPDQLSLALDQLIDMLKSAGLKTVAISDMQEAMKNLELYCFVEPKGRQYDLIPTAFPPLIRDMTIEKMEIDALVEKINTDPAQARCV